MDVWFNCLIWFLVVGHLEAYSSSLDDDVLGERLWEALQQASEDQDDDDFETRDLKASEKYKNNM